MNRAELRIPGAPVPKGRPRLGAGGRVFTPARTRVAEEAVAWACRARRVRFAGPVDVELLYCESRQGGDLDNLVKLTLDGLVKGGLLADDRQVRGLVASRRRVPRGEEATVVRVATVREGSA